MRHTVEPLRERRSDFLVLGLVVAFSAVYFLCFFNRFAGLRSGDGEFGGGIAFLSGLRPYRDYFTAGPPLNVFKSALILALFGKLLIVSRTFAVLERLLIATTLYVWLRRFFSQQGAALGAFVTIIVSAGDHTDPLASYNHDAIFFAMLCGLFACRVVGEKDESLLLIVCAGLFGGLSLITKQTVGGLAIFAVLICGLFAETKSSGAKRGLRWALLFLLGVLIPVLAVAAYLWRLGALHACLDMMFVSGPKAKASHKFAFVIREIIVAGAFRWWLLASIIGIFLCARPFAKALDKQPQKTLSGHRQILLWSAIVCAALFVLAFWWSARSSSPLLNTGKAVVYFILLGTAYFGLISLQRALDAAGAERTRAFQLALFSFLSFAIAVSLSLSFPAFEAMVLPGLGLLLAAAFDGTGIRGRAILVVITTVLVFFQAAEKFAVPFGFDSQDELPISKSTLSSDEPMLRGMKLPGTTIHFIQDVQRTMRERAGSDGTLFTYPEMGLLYSLCGRYPPTRTASHNMDVVNDDFARSEAERLRRAPPAVIIYAKPSESDTQFAELLWREGKRSGQRSMMDEVDHIVAGYDLIGTYQLAPQDTAIKIYARRIENKGLTSGPR